MIHQWPGPVKQDEAPEERVRRELLSSEFNRLVAEASRKRDEALAAIEKEVAGAREELSRVMAKTSVEYSQVWADFEREYKRLSNEYTSRLYKTEDK